MHNDNKKANVICLSNQLWDFPLWTNKKHVMSRLGKRGFNVLFVDPPINTGRLFFKQLINKKWTLKRLLTSFKKDKETSVTVFSPLNFVPANKYSSQLFVKRINSLTERIFNKKLKTILWVYHVEAQDLDEYIKNIPHDVLVYDCVDNYPAFPRYDTPAKKIKITKQEEYLAKSADIVFATAPGLVDKLTRLNPKTFFTPNVGDYELFSKVNEFVNDLPGDLESLPKPRIGFTGAIDEYKFDRKLMQKLAQEHPDYTFVIIGLFGLKDREATSEELGFTGLKNIHFLGSRDYKLMPRYLAGFDAMIIPYQLNDYTVGGCFPVKFHEALAAGLPVVVTDLPAYKPFEKVCYISKNYDDFSNNVRNAIQEDNDRLRKERRAVAKENNWEGKVDKMLSLIDSEVTPL